MKKRLRRAFSIIELVIVIAIIAILAAVLIPTFANVVHKANESADVQVVRQINTLLTAENPKSSGELKQGLEANGINAENCTPIVNNTSFYWVPAENVVVYYNEGKQQVTFPEQYQDLAYNPSGWLKFPISDSTSLTVVTAGQAATVGVVADNAESTPITVNVPADATEASALKLTVEDVTPGGISTLSASDGTAIAGNYTFEIALSDENGQPVTAAGGQSFTVTIQIPKGLNANSIKVYHNDDPLATEKYSYAPATGIVTIDTSGFSPYTVRWNATAIAAISGEPVSFGKVTVDNNQWELDGVTYDLTNIWGYTPNYAVNINFDPTKLSGINEAYGSMYIHWVFVADQESYCLSFAAMNSKYLSSPKENVFGVLNAASGFPPAAKEIDLMPQYSSALVLNDTVKLDWLDMMDEDEPEILYDFTTLYIRSSSNEHNPKDTAYTVIPGRLEVRLYEKGGSISKAGNYIVIDSIRVG